MTELSEKTAHLTENRRKLLACIDRILDSLGPDVRRAITYHMRRKYSLKRYEIPDRPKEFSLALSHIFGKSSAGIEREITKLIVEEFRLGPGVRLSFVEAVREAVKSKK